MEAAIRDLIRRIHEQDRPAVLALTGGGASAAAWLLSVPGGSRTVLEVVVPYAQPALEEWLARAPESYCSAATATAMARRACQRAVWLCPGAEVLGVASTASLRSDRPKKGEHRVHVAV